MTGDDDLPQPDSAEPMTGRLPQPGATGPRVSAAIAPPHVSLAQRARAVVRGIVWLVAAWMICHTWCVDGLFVPLEIPSGSMAETLRGRHSRFVCAVCGQAFLCGADATPGRWRVCPHCGDVTENRLPVKIVAGDRVWLVRAAFDWREPRRWEVVAFREPDRAGRLAVKRVVGLPGETVEIRGGDVYVGGEIRRKTLDEQSHMAVLVHDAAVRGAPEHVAALRWRPDTAESGWRHGANGSFTFQGPRSLRERARVRAGSEKDGSRVPDVRESTPPSPPTPLPKGEGRGFEPVDWLVYHHRSRAGRTWADGPVTDELAYNQWRTRREEETHPVADLLLRFRADDIQGDGWLVVRAAEAKNRLEAWIQPETGACEFRFNAQVVRRGRTPIATPIRRMDVTFSTVDRQLLLALDGRTAVGRLLLPAGCEWEPSSRPLAIGSAGLRMTLSAVRVYRDVYYARPAGVLARWGFDRPARLGKDEYFVLGDNSLVSEDSRSWPNGPGVPARLVVGKPVVVPRP